MRYLALAVSLLAVLSTAVAQNPPRDTALGALRNLPAEFRNGIVWLSADNVTPDTDTWYVTARNASRGGLPMNLTLTRGRIVSERPTISPRLLTRQLSPMNLASLRVNSTDLWRAALRFASARDRRLGSLSLQLSQSGRNASPLWSIWCYDRRGSYIGFFTTLATTASRD